MSGPDDPRDGYRPSEPLLRLYPEAGVGGFSRHDGFIEFYTRVNALLGPGSRVLDFGAGRAWWATEPLSPTHRSLRSLHERVATVDGVDVDEAIRDNPTLARVEVIGPHDPLPFADASYDLVLADYVLEHVPAADAGRVAGEILRVLRPGGWLAARTPNKWGQIGVGARLVPNHRHVRALRRLQPDRRVADVFPTEYAMNTRRDLRRLFDAERNQVVVYGHQGHPGYAGSSVAAWRAAALAGWLTPPLLAPTFMVFVQKAA